MSDPAWVRAGANGVNRQLKWAVAEAKNGSSSLTKVDHRGFHENHEFGVGYLQVDQGVDPVVHRASYSMASVTEVDPERRGLKSAAHHLALGFSENDQMVHVAFGRLMTVFCGVIGFQSGRVKMIRVSVDAR